MYTQDEFEEDIAYLESCRAKVRLLVVAASELANPWKIDGLEAKRRLDILDRLVEECETRRKNAKFVIARSIENGVKERNRLGGKRTPRRTKLGYMFREVTHDQAMSLKHKGFEVQHVGAGKGWRVRIS